MTEFRFVCPSCKRQIQCDTSYCGTQINCPGCQQIIVVPPTQGAGGALPAGVNPRTFQTVLITCVSVIVLAALLTAGWFGYSKFRMREMSSGLVKLWTGNGSGNDSAQKINLTIPKGVGYAPAPGGQGFLLDNQSQPDDTPRIVAPDSPELNMGANQDFSIMAWIKPKASPGNYTDLTGEVMTVVSKRYCPDAFTALGYEMYLGGGRLCFQMIDSLKHGGNFYKLDAESDLRDGKFHHIAVTVQRNSTTGLRFYVDGHLIVSFDPTAVSGDLSNASPLRIGNHPDPGFQCFYNGIIGRVRLYRRALSDSEIQTIYKSQE